MNTSCSASLGELGWESCADDEMLLSSCGLSPPNPRSPSPVKPRHAEKPKPTPPPKPTKPKKRPAEKHKSFESSSSSSSLDQALPRGHGKEVKRKQQRQQKRHEEPPSLEGDEPPDPLLGAQVFVPYTEGVYPGVVTWVVGGRGGGWNTQGERRCFGLRGICCMSLMLQQ